MYSCLSDSLISILHAKLFTMNIQLATASAPVVFSEPTPLPASIISNNSTATITSDQTCVVSAEGQHGVISPVDELPGPCIGNGDTGRALPPQADGGEMSNFKDSGTNSSPLLKRAKAKADFAYSSYLSMAYDNLPDEGCIEQLVDRALAKGLIIGNTRDEAVNGAR